MPMFKIIPPSKQKKKRFNLNFFKFDKTEEKNYSEAFVTEY